MSKFKYLGVVIALFVLVSPGWSETARLTKNDLVSVVTNARVGDTTLNFVATGSRSLVASINHDGLTLIVAGRLAANGQSQIEVTAAQADGESESATLMLTDAANGDFSSLYAVAQVVGWQSARTIATVSNELLDNDLVPDSNVRFVLAAIAGMATQIETTEKVAWPWDYTAYAVCYWSCVSGCNVGCVASCPGDYCFTMCEGQCGHFTS